jgi:hypothetical protein
LLFGEFLETYQASIFFFSSSSLRVSRHLEIKLPMCGRFSGVAEVRLRDAVAVCKDPELVNVYFLLFPRHGHLVDWI